MVNFIAKAGTKFDKRGEVKLSPLFARANTLKNNPLWVNASADNPPNTYLIRIDASFRYSQRCKLVINDSTPKFCRIKLLELRGIRGVSVAKVKILGVTKSFHFKASIRTHSRQYLRLSLRRTRREIVIGTKF